MFKVNDLRELIRMVDNSNIEELIVKGENNEKVEIRKRSSQAVVETAVAPVAAAPAPVAAPVAAPAPATPVVVAAVPVVDESLHKITSPMVGTFYAAPSPEDPEYVKVGDKVTPESIVCIVEAMKLMNELEAEVTGEIVEILVENGQLIEYGQPIFLVKK